MHTKNIFQLVHQVHLLAFKTTAHTKSRHVYVTAIARVSAARAFAKALSARLAISPHADPLTTTSITALRPYKPKTLIIAT